MLKYRLLLGPVLIALLIALIWADEAAQARWGYPALLLFPLMLGLGLIAARELTKIFRARQINTSKRINSLAVALGLAASSFSTARVGPASGVAVVCTAAGVAYVTALLYYSRRKNVEGVVASSAATLLAFTYVGLLGGFLIMLRNEYSAWLLLAIVLTVKSYDIGAYTAGRLFGRHKLIPWLSPGKTWEGLVGGLLFSTLVGVGVVAIFGERGIIPPFTLWQGAVAGLIFGGIGQAGDLAASLLKRDAGIKDYSRALPGFGGILDVIDSPLLVAPVAYWLIKMWEQWGGIS